MKKYLWGLLTGRVGAAAKEPEALTRPLDSEQLIELMRCFPIGGKIRYFPNANPDLVFDSIVIAYGINNHLVYTQNDIRVDGDGRTPVFMLEDDWKDKTVREVRRFCFIVPDVGSSEGGLDYDRRAALDSGGRFERGEALTLMSLGNDRGVPHVSAAVRKHTTLKEGYYANHAVVVLEVSPETLNHVDQRQQYRVKTRIPIALQVAEDLPPCDCLLVDFSEASLKIEIDESETRLFAAINRKRSVIATIDLPGQGRKFVLLGKVVRKGEDFAVLSLVGQLEGDRYKEIELLDALDLKATLLQHPATRS